MPTDTATARYTRRIAARCPRKLWLSDTEDRMLSDLAQRGSLSRSAAMRYAILYTWEHTFQSGPGRRTG